MTTEAQLNYRVNMVWILTIAGFAAAIRQKVSPSPRYTLSTRLQYSNVVTRNHWADVVVVDQQQFAEEDCCTVDEYVEWQEQGLKALFLYSNSHDDPIGVIEWEFDQGLYLASIIILPAFQSQGYATEAVAALMARFHQPRTWCKILDTNMASKRVFAKLGFKSTDKILAREYRVYTLSNK
jgi:RimJ/RimL family protein N-acetyltransferase